MEHVLRRNLGYFRTSAALFGLLVLLISGLGCNSPNPTPETTDPIYLDLLAEVQSAEKALLASSSELEELNKTLKEMPPRNPLKRQLMQQISNQKQTSNGQKERKLYFEARADQRKVFARREYLKAFENGESWPKPEEFAAYRSAKKLQSASRSWDDRVPKLTRHLRAVSSEATPSAK